MSGINQEFHLLFIHLPVRPATISIDKEPDKSCQRNEIEDICPYGMIPWRCHFDGDGLYVRTKVTNTRPHLDRIATWLQMTQQNDINALRITHPCSVSDTVFIDNASWIVEIEQREFQSQFCLHIGNLKMVGGNNWPRFTTSDSESR